MTATQQGNLQIFWDAFPADIDPDGGVYYHHRIGFHGIANVKGIITMAQSCGYPEDYPAQREVLITLQLCREPQASSAKDWAALTQDDKPVAAPEATAVTGVSAPDTKAAAAPVVPAKVQPEPKRLRTRDEKIRELFDSLARHFPNRRYLLLVRL